MTRKIIVDLCAGPDHHFKEDSIVEFVFDGGTFRVKFDGDVLDINLKGNKMEPMVVIPHSSNVILVGMKERP